MAKPLNLIVFLFWLNLVGGEQVLQCFQAINATGNDQIFTQSQEDLAITGFDNTITSCIFSGVWVLYEDYRYNSDDQNKMVFFAYGDNLAINMPQAFDKRTSSLRYVGNCNYTTPAITLFQQRYFMGDDIEIEEEEVANLPGGNFGRSLIINGGDDWTIFQEPDFQGPSLCIHGSGQARVATFIPDPATLGPLSGRISSLKRGCD